MIHYMKLANTPFCMISTGEKTIELRLYDEKRQKISIGDTIVFVNLTKPENRVRATVRGLFRFNSFKELYSALPLEKCGYTSEQVKEASPCDMYEYYSQEEEEKYGVLGIAINLQA